MCRAARIIVVGRLADESVRRFTELPYVALSEGADDELGDPLRERDVRPNTQFVESDDYAVMAMVETGLGVSIMPQLVLAGTTRRVTTLPLDPPGWRDLGIAYRDDRQASTLLRAFLDNALRFVAGGGEEAQSAR